MINAVAKVPEPPNEPVLEYKPGSPEKAALKAELNRQMNEVLEIPLIIGGEEVKTGDMAQAVCPHNHKHVLAHYHKAGADHVAQAAEAAHQAWHGWANMPWEARVAVFRKAGDLLATKYRQVLNAATMLNQGKTVQQAEIDSACELIDFLRFNPWYAQQVYENQPGSQPGMWNYVDHRALEGFVFCVTPFNFTAIAGNLPTAPAMMGNTVLWKPASSAVHSAYYLAKLFEEAGVPPGVINMIPGSGGQVGDPVLAQPGLAGVHFTGSTPVFQSMWTNIGANIASYRTYPRIVGETGGKDFIFVHPSADPEEVVAGALRGAFEYQGQKCSAASRMYIPSSLQNVIEERLVAEIAEMTMGDVNDFRNFMGAVIDKWAYKEITGYIEYARESDDAEILGGGDYSDEVGYFIRPTLIRTTDPKFKLMEEEIFGPVLTYYVYDDSDLDSALDLCDQTSPYALTGAVFARERGAVVKIMNHLRNAAGNFYINDKPTGAVVNQQPFGGGRASGTNDKAGSVLNLVRWVTPRTVKETFVPPTGYKYSNMDEE